MGFFANTRNIFLSIAVVAVVIGLFTMIGVPSTAHATDHSPLIKIPGKDLPGRDLPGKDLPGKDVIGSDTNSNASNTKCSIENFGVCIARGILEIGIWTLQFSLFVLGLVGTLLDVALLLTFNMAAIINPASSIGQAVALGWSLFRDLANLMFIAGFVWVSIAMILGVNIAGNNGKFIANVIIAALLVNFSYFFTGVIIDASNTVSRLVYQQGVMNGQKLPIGNNSPLDMIGFVTGNDSGAKFLTTASTTEEIEGNVGFIGSMFLQQTKLVTILDPEVLRNQADTEGSPLATLSLLVFLGVVLIGLTIRLFASMFFIILVRFVSLIVLLILSPLLVFRIMGIKPFSEWGNHWWKELQQQVIFLPVFMLMTAVSFGVIGGFFKTLAAGDVSFGKLLDNPSGENFQAAIGLAILFAISYYLLESSKSIAENLSQGKAVPLPSVSKWQEGAAKWGNAVGSRAQAVGVLPKTLSLLTLGGGLKALGWAGQAGARATGIPSRVGGAVQDVRGIPDRLSRKNRFDEARGKRVLGAIPSRITKANASIKDWETQYNTARGAGDTQGMAMAQQQISAAKASRKKAIDDMHDTLGPEKMARTINALKKEDQTEVLDALDTPKAKAITDLWTKGQGKATGKERNSAEAKALSEAVSGTPGESKKPIVDEATDSSTGETLGKQRLGKLRTPGDTRPSPDMKSQFDTIISELKTLNRTERISRFERDRSATKELLADKENITKLRSELGRGSLGELPPDIIIENQNVLARMDKEDLDMIARRTEGVTQEQYEKIKTEMRRRRPGDVKKHETSPASMARHPVTPKPEKKT